jgi:pimeloyl-ACP methyl ester carboxylesterase
VGQDFSAPAAPTAAVLAACRLRGRDLDLAADVGGPVDAPCVVLLPGAGQTRRAWRAVARSLARRYRVISLDLRGHGESGWARDGDYLIDAFVGDVLAVVSQIAVPTVLVGASIGGIAAMLAAASGWARHVAGLVLVDVVPDMEAKGLQRIRDFMSAHADGFASLDDAADAVSAFLPHRPRPASNSGLAGSLRSCPDGRLRWHWDPAFHAGSAARSGMFECMALAATSVTVPTLLISGGNSEVVSGEGARKLLAALPNAEWVDVAGAAHMVAGDSNDSFSLALAAFLDRTLQTVAGTPQAGEMS